MTQILSIFRKDVRHLAPFILGLLALHSVYAAGLVRSVMEVSLSSRLQTMLSICELLFPFLWAFVLMLLVQQDTPFAENLFWLTRPYSWSRLLAAKVLFVLFFLNLPLLLADCLILQTVGLPLDFSHLLLGQLPLIALIILPAFSLACVSRNISQFALFGVGALILLGISDSMFSRILERNPKVRIPDVWGVALLLVVTSLALVIAYARRAFPRSLLALAVAIPILLIYFTTHLYTNGKFYLPRPVADASSNHPGIEAPGPSAFRSLESIEIHGVNIPMLLSNLPPGVVLVGEGETQIASASKPVATRLTGSELNLAPYGKEVERAQKISFQSSLDVWMLNDKPTFRTTVGSTDLTKIPHVGICRIPAGAKAISCWSGPVRNPEVLVRPRGIGISSYSLPPGLNSSTDWYRYEETSWGFSPVERRDINLGKDNVLSLGEQVSFTPRFPVGHFHTTVKADQTSVPSLLHR